DMLQAMNTGHEGSLSTCHANSPDDALRRLETMVLMGEVALPLQAVRAQLESALDLVVQVARRPDGHRRVVAVAEVRSPDGSSIDGDRTSLLADGDDVVSLPSRPMRSADASPPDPKWLER
ncbi:MAG: ATPase, T2SS/T4P/T4SS family, partial [Acidimicrobiales bacterium]